jgi:hypothetical protein
MIFFLSSYMLSYMILLGFHWKLWVVWVIGVFGMVFIGGMGW